jgi:formylglycine-generating enzyme required for sulfatase activity
MRTTIIRRTIIAYLILTGLHVSAAEPRRLADCDGCPELVRIPAGKFLMGSTQSETDREGVPPNQADPERPRHRVEIPEDFLLGKYEVSRAEFRQFVIDTGYESGECLEFRDGQFVLAKGSNWDLTPIEQDEDHPVMCVDWQDAVAYTDWLSVKTGARYRLPSEAEWEYAARANTTTARYWGDGVNDACEHTNVADANAPRPQFECVDPHPFTAPVSYGIANDFGLFGILGNLGEWVADCGYPDYADATGDAAAVMSGDCSKHVGRGGSWWNDAYYIRAARRYSFAGRYTIVGFRVAREL